MSQHKIFVSSRRIKPSLNYTSTTFPYQYTRENLLLNKPLFPMRQDTLLQEDDDDDDDGDEDEVEEFKDVVRTPPAVFDKKLKVSITDHLNSKLANKVVPNVGLCITLFDIQQLEDSYIFPGDGAAHTKVEFRFVVFRPFIDEIVIGKIRSCTKDGVHVTLGFFDDILIPPSNLQHPSRFDETEQVWVWEFDNDGDKHDLFMDPGEKMKFRVVSELFVETSPVQCPDNPELPDTVNTEPKVPYSITASINEPGLGVLSWWDGA